MADYRQFYNKSFEDMCDEILALREYCNDYKQQIKELGVEIENLEAEIETLKFDYKW